MSVFSIDLQWLSAPSVAHPIERRTWAEISIRINDTLLTELHDPTTNSVRPGFYGSALPLAEWVATNALSLVHERREPRRDSEAWFDWRDRHSFRVARAGNAMPDLFVRRLNADWAELQLRGDAPLPGIAVRFLNQGTFQLGVDDLNRGLFAFLRTVQERLGSATEAGREVFDRAMSMLSADADSIVAARLGLPRGLTSLSDAEIVVAEASTAATDEDRLREAREVARQLPPPRAPDSRWIELAERIGGSSQRPRPWQTGWAAARAVRAALGLTQDAPSHEVFERSSVRVDDVATASSLGTEVDSIHVKEPGGPPRVVTIRRDQNAQRFRAARALFHGLYGGRDRFIAESPLVRSPEANAFAAELLAPVKRLESRRPENGSWTESDLVATAKELGAAPDVIRHQVQNHHELGELALEA